MIPRRGKGSHRGPGAAAAGDRECSSKERHLLGSSAGGCRAGRVVSSSRSLWPLSAPAPQFPLASGGSAAGTEVVRKPAPSGSGPCQEPAELLPLAPGSDGRCS